MWGRKPTRPRIEVGSRPQLGPWIALWAGITLLLSGAAYWGGTHEVLGGSEPEPDPGPDCDACVAECPRCQEAKERAEAAAHLSSMEGAARRELQAALQALGEEVMALERELSLYRGVLTEEGDGTGLRIQNAAFTPGRSDGVYHYQLVLTQVGADPELREGRVAMEIFGLLEGEPQQLRFEEDDGRGTAMPGFELKYFQELNDSLVLPDGFEPERAEIILLPEEGDPVARVVSWTREDGAYVQGEAEEAGSAD